MPLIDREIKLDLPWSKGCVLSEDDDNLSSTSFKNGDINPARYSFNKYYMPLVEIKDFNVLINNKHLINKQGY